MLTIANIKVLRDPGFLYDLHYLFFARFNTQLCIDSLADSAKREPYKKYLKEMVNRFGDISEELYVFYHANKNGRCFMTTNYMDPYKELFATDFDFRFLMSLLSDGESVRRDLIRFYLHGLSDEEFEECLTSTATLFSYIKKSEYTDEVKSKLYEFFISPEPYVSALKSELTEKEIRLSAYYKDNYQTILDVHNNTTFEALCEKVKDIENSRFLKNYDQCLYTSFCLINKYQMQLFFVSDGAVYILGFDYESIIEAIVLSKNTCPIEDMCSALGEGSRVRIIEMLLREKELTCKEIERAFSFSGSTTYHHITLLTKVGALKFRNVGKLIYYSINRDFFDQMREQLILFSNQEKR